jgi:hypothetical protein
MIYQYRKAKEEGIAVENDEIVIDIPETPVAPVVIHISEKYRRIVDQPICRGWSYEEYVERSRDENIKKRAACTRNARREESLPRFIFGEKNSSDMELLQSEEH